jgi:hypothetical protein
VRTAGGARDRHVQVGSVEVLPAAWVHAEKKTCHAVEQDRPDVLSQRRAWFDAQPDLDPGRLVFVDETWTATNMARSHGRCPRGARLRMGFPHGHRKTTTLVAGLRLSGMVAPMVLDGPINGDWFEAYVRHVLAPTLKPGDIVIMDNLSSHKRVAARQLIEAAGAELRFLPPYSPDPCVATNSPPDRLLYAPHPSRWRSQNSRRSYEKPPNEPLRDSGTPSDASSISSRPTRAPTSSPQRDMNQNDRETL